MIGKLAEPNLTRRLDLLAKRGVTIQKCANIW